MTIHDLALFVVPTLAIAAVLNLAASPPWQDNPEPRPAAVPVILEPDPLPTPEQMAEDTLVPLLPEDEPNYF